MREWIICGWYTPDYKHWADKLLANLEAIGGPPHDFVEIPKADGGWEVNTLSKPRQILNAMDRHPDKTIVFLDVDCQITGTIQDLDDLVNISGDVGVYVRTRFRSAGDVRFGPRSGTLVIRPTQRAREFVEIWSEQPLWAPRYAVDQDTLKVAMGLTTGLSVTMLSARACALEGEDIEAPIVLHSRSNRELRRRGRFWSRLGLGCR